MGERHAIKALLLKQFFDSGRIRSPNRSFVRVADDLDGDGAPFPVLPMTNDNFLTSARPRV